MDEQCKFCGLLQQPLASMHMAGCLSSEHFKETLRYDTPIKEETFIELKGEDAAKHKAAIKSFFNPRRQFDLSKLSKSDGFHYIKREVLEAYNEGRIEELLEGWLGE